ncbi:MAG: hypothetical protein BWK79_03005 [Beggiatoa sp. IS2]|nr:MAG: hypothetical protein BWK79_03005 [Beggiatoa sp. IS2]
MKINRFVKYIAIGTVSLSLLVWFIHEGIEKAGITTRETIHIAVIGDMEKEGKSFVQGIQLYIDAVNKEGGVNGKDVILDTFDDKNNPEVAAEQALKIVQENRALAVVGHYYSNCSIAGGNIYKKYGIPAITPAATSVAVTKDNEWYFRTVFNDNLQGRFIANYLKKVLHQNSVIVIHEDGTYGSYLANIFLDTAHNLNLEIAGRYQFEVNNQNLNARLEEIVADVKTKGSDSFIFIAAQAKEGTKIIKRLKDENIKNRVIVPAALASKTFQEGFKDDSKEKLNPGFYTDGIYISAPLIFDTANEKAQQFKKDFEGRYGEGDDIRAPFAYDTAMVIVEAIKNGGISGIPQTLREDRKKIKDYLAKINNIGDAIEGTTGFNYFDENGDAQKPVAMGVFKNEKIVSALVQLQSMRNRGEISDLEQAHKEERILLIDDEYMYKTNVVYVGVEINEISDLDLGNLTYSLDFFLWFRYRGDIEPQEVEFLNALEPIRLPAPVKIETMDDMTRQLYRIKSRFKVDFLSRHNFMQHVLGVNLRHRDLTRNNLIYVTDIVGMGSVSSDELVKRLGEKQVLSPNTGWQVGQVLFFPDIMRESSLGSLNYLNVKSGRVDYSMFNMGLFIEHYELTLRRTIPLKWADKLSVLSGIALILLIMALKRDELKHSPNTILLFQTLCASLLLLSSEVVVLNTIAEEAKTISLEPFVKVFDVLWWTAVAWLLHSMAELFVWVPLEERSGRKIPRIARRFLAFTIYLMAIFAVIAFVFDQRLTSLLATSGVIAMIIGLAIQINISNIFSGIAINVEHPFRVGDWVQIGEFEEGKVVDITWRSTRIVTRMGCVLSIPNSRASESAIHNFDYPDSTYWIRFIVHVHPAHHPDRVQKIIRDAVLSAEAVVKKHTPYIVFRGVSGWAADYLCYFAAEDYTWRLVHEESVWKRIWIHLERAGISPAIQRQEIHLFKGVKERGEKNATDPLTLLKEIDIFRPFSEEAKNYLSDRIRSHRFPPNQIIVEQGKPGDSLFIIVEGVVGVRTNEKGEVARLGSGNFFGEKALMTGEERMATVISLTETYLFEITKEDIAGPLSEQPEVSELISKILAEREKVMNSRTKKETEESVKGSTDHSNFRKQIEKFFSSGKS